MTGLTRRQAVALPLGLAVAGMAVSGALAGEDGVERWGVHEIVLQGPTGGNPFVDVQLSATFRGPDGREVVAGGFHDGGDVYRVRFSPGLVGAWTWSTASNAQALNGRSGRFDVVPARAGNHGPVGVASGFHFAHADGTPYRQIGTTAYGWAQQSDARCATTLKTLSVSPFNKLRMCVFANVDAEPLEPFEVRAGQPGRFDHDRFNPAYFQKLETRVTALMALNIVADLILFHPYKDAGGFNAMTPEQDERYVRYMVARFSAFRNVWWSAANEYDLVKSKSVADFDRLLALIQAVDPHGRPRSIHNWRELYDNAKPWITHASLQHGAAVMDDTRAEIFRSVWGKPVIFDEVRYEGNLTQRWGNLSAEALVERFWHGLIGGTYVGHGEALAPPGGEPGDTWVGKGGVLRGHSAPRLAFLKSVMEAGPRPGLDPIDKSWDRHVAGVEGRYYLRYLGAEAPTRWAFSLPRDGLKGGERFRVERLDTWNMTVEPVDGHFTMAPMGGYDFHDPQRPHIDMPGRPWMALRVTRIDDPATPPS